MKEEIKHFKSLLRQGSLRHMNILLDDNFQKELLTIIKNYEKLQHENKQLKEQLLVTQTNEETFRLEMKDININYEGLSFEDKIKLKIYYLLSLPASEAVKSALLNLKWVLEIYQEEKMKGRTR